MELNAFRIVWILSGSILVIGWLVISFSSPSRSRTVVEWLSATAMYAAILAIFVSLALRAHASGNHFAVWAIGLLCAMFGGGLLVSAWKAVAALGGKEKIQKSATN